MSDDPCGSCGGQIEASSFRVFESSDGPLEVVFVECVSGHVHPRLSEPAARNGPEHRARDATAVRGFGSLAGRVELREDHTST